MLAQHVFFLSICEVVSTEEVCERARVWPRMALCRTTT